jgi:hypothetical protein
MKTEMVLEKSVSFINLTRLIAREDFIVYWDVAPCSPVDVDGRFGGVHSFHH